MGTMKLTFVNVGYGEAILLECPDPKSADGTFVMLIDGGSAEVSEFADRSTGRIPLSSYLEARGLTHIDVMVNTHIHEDHICGLLPAARAFPPAVLWVIPTAAAWHGEMKTLDVSLARTPSQRKFIRAINDWQTLCRLVEAHGGRVETPAAGSSGQLCGPLHYRILAPDTERIEELETGLRQVFAAPEDTFLNVLDSLDCRMNNFSLMMLLDFQGTRILLPGDTNRAGYGGIDPAMLKADLFKVGHHGQIDGADQPLLDRVRPRAVVCCASSDRRYNSAHPDLLRMMRDSGAELFFSDCPQLPGPHIPPHQALLFSIGENGGLTGQYL